MGRCGCLVGACCLRFLAFSGDSAPLCHCHRYICSPFITSLIFLSLNVGVQCFIIPVSCFYMKRPSKSHDCLHHCHCLFVKRMFSILHHSQWQDIWLHFNEFRALDNTHMHTHVQCFLFCSLWNFNLLFSFLPCFLVIVDCIYTILYFRQILVFRWAFKELKSQKKVQISLSWMITLLQLSRYVSRSCICLADLVSY